MHSKHIEDGLNQFNTTHDFVSNLIFSNEEVGIILGETTYASHTRNFTRLLPSIDGSKFSKTEWKVSIGTCLRSIDLDVMWTIHWLEHVTIDVTCTHQIG